MFKRLTKFVAALTVALASQFAHAGVPVIDVAAITQLLAQLESWSTQLEQMSNQVNSLKKQYDAISGGRGLGTILNDPALQNYIPKEARDVLTKVNNNGYAGLSGAAKALRDAEMIYNCMNVEEGGERTKCQADLARPYQFRAYYDDALARASERSQQIQQLMARAGSTSDAKEIAEVQARISAEGALLQHETTQINLMRGIAESEARLTESKAREAQLEALSRKGMLFGTPGTP